MKVLIWHENLRERGGGAPTYLYNLKQSVITNGFSDTIHFLSDFIDPINQVSSEPWYKKIARNILSDTIIGNLTAISYLRGIYRSSQYSIDLANYSVIHFHSTEHLFKARTQINDFRGKILLTSHSPVVYHNELITETFKLQSKKGLLPILRKKLEYMDEFSFKRADFLVFPCKESLEPYKNSWNKFEDIAKNKEIKYLLSATTEPVVKPVDLELKFGIPAGSFVITYVGRHNYIKGYDLLLSVGREILDRYSNVYFLILGKEGPFFGLQHQRWIEVGWTDVPHSFMSQSNLFVLPNRETYFDLVLLEGLALNCDMLISNSGGNAFFKNIGGGSINFFESGNKMDLMESIQNIIENGISKGNNITNRQLYDKYFSIKTFAKNYMEMIGPIFKHALLG